MTKKWRPPFTGKNTHTTELKKTVRKVKLKKNTTVLRNKNNFVIFFGCRKLMASVSQ